MGTVSWIHQEDGYHSGCIRVPAGKLEFWYHPESPCSL